MDKWELFLEVSRRFAGFSLERRQEWKGGPWRVRILPNKGMRQDWRIEVYGSSPETVILEASRRLKEIDEDNRIYPDKGGTMDDKHGRELGGRMNDQKIEERIVAQPDGGWKYVEGDSANHITSDFWGWGVCSVCNGSIWVPFSEMGHSDSVVCVGEVFRLIHPKCRTMCNSGSGKIEGPDTDGNYVWTCECGQTARYKPHPGLDSLLIQCGVCKATRQVI